MKKVKLIAFLMCVMMAACVLTGCAEKTPATEDGFTEIMQDAGFTVTDVTEETETNGLATAVIVAVSEDEGYQIEFWKLTDSETGEGVFYNNYNIFNEEHSVKTMSTETMLGNYNYYAFTADGDFHMISRIDDTMLYCEADKEYKEEIVDLVKALGYK